MTDPDPTRLAALEIVEMVHDALLDARQVGGEAKILALLDDVEERLRELVGALVAVEASHHG